MTRWKQYKNTTKVILYSAYTRSFQEVGEGGELLARNGNKTAVRISSWSSLTRKGSGDLERHLRFVAGTEERGFWFLQCFLGKRNSSFWCSLRGARGVREEDGPRSQHKFASEAISGTCTLGPHFLSFNNTQRDMLSVCPSSVILNLVPTFSTV